MMRRLAVVCLLLGLQLSAWAYQPALDMTGVALYWATVDGLRAGRHGADSAGALLTTHPGYRLIQRNGGRLRALT
jgi:hypothetical protein